MSDSYLCPGQPGPVWVGGLATLGIRWLLLFLSAENSDHSDSKVCLKKMQGMWGPVLLVPEFWKNLPLSLLLAIHSIGSIYRSLILCQTLFQIFTNTSLNATDNTSYLIGAFNLVVGRQKRENKQNKYVDNIWSLIFIGRLKELRFL